MGIEFGQSQRQSQKLAVSPRQMQGLRLLSKSLPELRAEILDEMARNPAIDDVERTLETNLSEVERQRDASADAMPATSIMLSSREKASKTAISRFIMIALLFFLFE